MRVDHERGLRPVTLGARSRVPLEILDVKPRTREDCTKFGDRVASVALSVCDTGRNHHDVPRAHSVVLISEAHLDLAREIEDDLVDRVPMKRDRVADADLLRNDCEIGIGVRNERKPRTRPPVVGIRAVVECVELKIAVKADVPRWQMREVAVNAARSLRQVGREKRVDQRVEAMPFVGEI